MFTDGLEELIEGPSLVFINIYDVHVVLLLIRSNVAGACPSGELIVEINGQSLLRVVVDGFGEMVPASCFGR